MLINNLGMWATMMKLQLLKHEVKSRGHTIILKTSHMVGGATSPTPILVTPSGLEPGFALKTLKVVVCIWSRYCKSCLDPKHLPS